MLLKGMNVMKKLLTYRLLSIAMFLLFHVGILSAQELYESIGKIRFTSEIQSGDPAVNIFYGFGTSYTDTTDQAEVEIPFLPPQNYYAWLNRVCDGPFAGDPCIWQEDFRGVPDSVASGDKTRFTLTFNVGLRNNTGGPLRLTILNPDWPEGVDSIHLVDPVVPTAFNKTFTRPATALIEDRFTTKLTLTVYYNLATLSVHSIEADKVGTNHLLVAPNPVLSGGISVTGQMDAGDHLLIVNSRGEVISRIEVPQSEEKIEVGSDIPSGGYFLLHLNREGAVMGRQTFQVIR